MTRIARRICIFSVAALIVSITLAAAEPPPGTQLETLQNPFDLQIAEQIERLHSPSVHVRAGAAEALAYLRAYTAADALAEAVSDRKAEVRREAVMALAWCGQREHVPLLIRTLEDEDWVVRQAARVALTNLTGMEWPYDALGSSGQRDQQAAAWRRWWGRASKQSAPTDVLALIDDEDLECRLRAVRALGALGGPGFGEDRASEAILDVVLSYRDRDHGKLTPLEKHLVQAGIRSLGRLRQPDAFERLVGLLNTAGWARYAADALGDFGSPEAVLPLIAAYPKFSRDLNNRTKNPSMCPSDDRYSGDNTQDRMHETPYAIAVALSRLPLDDPRHTRALRGIGAYLLANLPSDWDGGMLYEPEAFELVSCYLLERAGLRQAACDAAFEAAAEWHRWHDNRDGVFVPEGSPPEVYLPKLARKMYGDVPYVGPWLPAFCRQNDVSRLIELLQHESGWLRINAAKALMFLGDRRAVEPMVRLLAASHPEAQYGFSGVLEHAEYNDPTPRSREALVRALGRLGAKEHDAMLVAILEDRGNVLDIQHAAATALDELDTPAAVAALKRAEMQHPFHSVRMIAREALWRRGIRPSEPRAAGLAPAHALLKSKTQPGNPHHTYSSAADDSNDGSDRGAGINPAARMGQLDAIVFIKGDNEIGSDFNGQAGVDPWRQTYSITNSGPTYRRGRNLYILRPAHPDSARPDGKVTPLTKFQDGLVADCEVSWDGKRVIFARRLNGDTRNYRQTPYEQPELNDGGKPLLHGQDDPWWHIWEIGVDGTGLRQITDGPYHDVQPAYLPDDRIVFSSSRIGLRDEYHGYPCTGLSVMNADGSDVHPIGFNLGGDREPAVLDDGRIVFSRLDNFYSRLKTEMTLQVAFPDGTRNFALYGPERRAFWMEVHAANAAWTMRDGYRGTTDNRNRVLRLTQPQPIGRGRVIFTSSGGLAVAGPGRHQETKVPHDRKWAVTSPFPLDDRRVLCAATVKQFNVDGRIVTCGTEEFERLRKGPELFRSAVNIDLGLYVMDVVTGRMDLLYNDPLTGDFEARPIAPRLRPPVRSEASRNRSYTARLLCNSALNSREARTASRGRFVRVIEGRPVVSRHETQNNRPTNRWKNHGGTFARVLGTVPLAADGSFHVEVPADRLLHLQILDADRRTVNNQLFWLYARPGETRSCIGCHETPDTAQSSNRFPAAATVQPVKCLPTGGEFSYRAKAWLKGTLPDECEERTRTVRAVSLIGRQ